MNTHSELDSRSHGRLGWLGTPKFSARARAFVMALELFIGIGAIWGGYGLLADAEGLGVKEAWLDGSPFSDYTAPGAFLFVVIAGGMLASAAVTWRRSLLAVPAAFVMGSTLLAWLVIETAIIGWQGSQQVGLLGVCGASALVLMGSAVSAWKNRI